MVTASIIPSWTRAKYSLNLRVWSLSWFLQYMLVQPWNVKVILGFWWRTVHSHFCYITQVLYQTYKSCNLSLWVFPDSFFLTLSCPRESCARDPPPARGKSAMNHTFTLLHNLISCSKTTKYLHKKHEKQTLFSR